MRHFHQTVTHFKCFVQVDFIVGQDIVLFVQSDHFVRIGLADYKLVIDLFVRHFLFPRKQAVHVQFPGCSGEADLFGLFDRALSCRIFGCANQVTVTI